MCVLEALCNQMRILFIDDEPEHVTLISEIIHDALGIEVEVVGSVEAAVALLHERPFTLVVTDIFIPLGDNPRQSLGPRARRYEENLAHLGGLVLLDELDRVEPPPIVLAHTACTDFELLEILGERVHARVPKPAPVDVLLKAVMDALDLPSPQ
ncbi:MAG: CheY-like chemotaxis protein [Myxococcota bacterium]|jgi:CheY-like chemotaxis protein